MRVGTASLLGTRQPAPRVSGGRPTKGCRAAAEAGQHLSALLRKNAVLKRRQWAATCCPLCPFAAFCELVLPLAVIALLSWAKTECASGPGDAGVQCQKPVLAGWGGHMPLGDQSTDCIEGLPLSGPDSGADTGDLGTSSCVAWTQVFGRPLPFYEVLAYLYWSGKRLALAADRPEDLPKVELIRDFIAEHWHPDMWLNRIPCANLERPVFTVKDLERGHIGHDGGEFLLPCERHFGSWWPNGTLPSFRNLTHHRVLAAGDLQSYLDSPNYGSDGLLYGAVVFHEIGGSGKPGAAGKWSYSLRMNVSSRTSPFTRGPSTRPLDLGLRTGEAHSYLDRGFVSLQLLLDRYIIGSRQHDANTTKLLESNGIILDRNDSARVREQLAEPLRYAPQSLEAVPMPVGGVVIDGFYEIAGRAFPVVFIVSFLYTQKSIINELIMEKETKLRESLRMLGVSSFAIFGSWYATYGLIFGGICTIFAAAAGLFIFPSSQTMLVFTFFWLWSMSFVAFALFTHSFFNQAKTGGIVGVILMFMQWVVYASQNRDGEPAPATTQQLLLFLPNGAFCLGLDILSKFEASKVGATFDNLHLPVLNSCFGAVLLTLMVDIVLWTFVGWYLDLVLPKEFGVRLPVHFLCLPSYWRGPAAPLGEGAAQEEVAAVALENATEEVPAAVSERSAASGMFVRTRGLRREFSTPGGLKVAVAGLDLTMYEGQVLACLGHNGAGKSTTINMLTGMVAPTSGDALVAGRSIRTEMREIRRTIGVCPQHDVLWPELTVLEHLHTFAKIRSVPRREVADRAQEMLRAVGLTEKAATRAGALSGGQRRKLSLCLALIGRPCVCFLDEPTSGMDPFSRRSTWNIIRDFREGRVTVLTTHFMDEADVLGDRIAILAGGRLQCCGSSLFLKNRFGAGYRITCCLSRGDGEASGTAAASSAPAASSSAGVVALVRRHLPEAEVLTDVGAELSLRLPTSAASRFAALFDELDAASRSLGLEHYGLSMVTLEEVFLRIASGKLEEEKLLQETGQAASSIAPAGDSSRRAAQCSGDRGEERLPGGPRLPSAAENAAMEPLVGGGSLNGASEARVWLRHLTSLFKKRAQYGRRDYKAMVCMVLVPVAWLAFGLWILQYIGDRRLPMVPLAMAEQYGGDHAVPFNATIMRRGVQPPLVPGDVEGAQLQPEDLDSGLKTGVFFGRKYVHGVPEAKLCEEMPHQMSKCWRQERLCDAVWPQLNEARNFGLEFECETDRHGCKQAIEGLCSDGAWRCVDRCEKRVATISPQVCEVQCKELCVEARRFSWACDLLFNFTVAWVCPQTCAGHGEDTCPRGSVCRQASLHHAVDPADTLAFEVQLFSEGQGTTNEAVRYGALHTTDLDSVGTVATLLYNTSAVHVVPTLLNFLSSGMKRVASGGDSSITVFNHPMPFTAAGDVNRVVSAVVDLFSTFVVIQAFSFIPAAIVAYVVREREAHHNSKHQQLLSGVSLTAYWMANLLWDMCVYIVPLALSMLFIWGFHITVFVDHGALVASFVIFLGYGFAIAPFSYFMSFLFSKHTVAQVVCLVANFVAGLILVEVSYILAMIENTKAVNNVLMWIFRVFPGFSLGHGLLQVCTNSVIAGLVEAAEGVAGGRVNLLAWDIAGADVCYLYASAPCFFVLSVLLDYVRHCPLAGAAGKRLDPTGGPVDDEDEDVEGEACRVSQPCDDVVRLVGLRKVYRTPEGRPKVAVRGLSFGLSRGECFGFLGINGAGKTSTLNMLTGAILPSDGFAQLGGYDVVKEQWRVRRLLGYCPQHDALLDKLTTREHLHLFGRIKGLPGAKLPSSCEAMVQALDLTSHLDKMASTLSGGNKRKLSLAIAMMGAPQLIFLDEPSTGVDPAARRLMWDVVADASVGRRQSTVVLTTHNMEEAEALCTKIGIMVGGRLRCIGSNQHLKARFGGGYQLEARLACPSDVEIREVAQEWRLPVEGILPQEFVALCARLGAPHRASWLREGCEEGCVIFEAFSRSSHVSSQTFAEWWLLEDWAAELGAALQEHFPGTIGLERHDRTLRFRLPEKCSLAQVFRRLEDSRKALRLEEYGLSQTTLEQIFNEFAAQQQEETGPVQGVYTGMRAAGGRPSAASSAGVELCEP